MKYGLLINSSRDIDHKVAKRITAFLTAQNITVVVDPEYNTPEVKELAGVEFTGYKDCELLISLGGDGTLLYTAHLAYEQNIPIIGVNLGSIGFMAEINVEDLEPALQALINKNYSIEQRMQLRVRCIDVTNHEKANGFALNDVVISRGPAARILTYDVAINDEVVERIPADGIIISTPTGSTGYTMSAGGPIVDPKLEAILLTPICPHTLHNRSYVLKSSSKVSITCQARPTNAYLAIDGREVVKIVDDDRIEIWLDDRYMRLIKIKEESFYAQVAKKIHLRTL